MGAAGETVQPFFVRVSWVKKYAYFLPNEEKILILPPFVIPPNLLFGNIFLTENILRDNNINTLCLACSCGLYVYSNCGDDVFKDRFYILDNYLIFGVSYFFYDIGSMYMVYRYSTNNYVCIVYIY